jgi:hypothetical protein
VSSVLLLLLLLLHSIVAASGWPLLLFRWRVSSSVGHRLDLLPWKKELQASISKVATAMLRLQ